MKFLNFLSLLFVAAKIFGFIDWSWMLVFAPTMLAFIIWLLGILILAIVELKG
ncbi:hypothetical protein [Brochothrix thermosphacta]|uniref:hypothetical protein n=1 Tax=Brochothrix thermosphacta TaxID=2756 RepID=UPI003F96D7AE